VSSASKWIKITGTPRPKFYVDSTMLSYSSSGPHTQKCCLPPAAATLLPGDRPVQVTWDLEMGRDEQELPGVSGGQ
jgi:hypothetical protein